MLTRAESDKRAHPPKYKRLTYDGQVAALRLRKLGKTQYEIAEALNCDQGTVCRWLQACDDSTAEATTFLRGQALPMAQKLVKRGGDTALVAALKGVSVLQEQPQAGVVIQIGIKDSDVQVLSVSPAQLEVQSESLQIQQQNSPGSDK